MARDVRVTVLMGGPSAEHDISLRSGQGVVAALAARGWPVQALVIPREVSVEEASCFVRQSLRDTETELVFIALHGSFGEDGTIQTLCEELGIQYVGSGPTASRFGLDKVASRAQFEQASLAVPRWHVLSSPTKRERDACLKTLQFPVVVKPTNQGSSIGVSIASTRTEFLKALEDAARYDTRILIEGFVRGRELTVGILGHEALPVVEIRSTHQFFDFTAKYTPGQTEYLVPAPLDPETTRQVQRAGAQAHQALGCRHFSRVDLILDDHQRPVILEVNTIPGFTATSLLPKAAACAGIPYDELCERLVRGALESDSRDEADHQPMRLLAARV